MLSVELGKIRRGANYLWRIIATALSFALFGAGALTVSYGIIPYIYFKTPDPGERLRKCRYAVHRAFCFVFWYMQKLGVVTLKLENIEKLRSIAPAIIMANHPTLIDVVLLIALMPQVDCVIKEGLWANPFVRRIVEAAGYVSNTREQDANQFIDACVGRLQGGSSLIVFPEGSRSPQGQLRKFHRGPSLIALRSGKPILPVILTCTPPALYKGHVWYRIPKEAFCLSLKVLEPIDVGSIVEEGQNSWISGRKLTTYLQSYFETRVLGSEEMVRNGKEWINWPARSRSSSNS